MNADNMKELATKVPEITISEIGFVSIEGFAAEKIEDYILLDGKVLYC